jgi:hypothetical protein
MPCANAAVSSTPSIFTVGSPSSSGPLSTCTAST